MAFFLLSLLTLVFSLILVNFQRITQTLVIPQIMPEFIKSSSPLLSYNSLFTFLGIFYEFFYLCAVSIMILYAFYKTQSCELAYFLIFLFSILLDSFRIFIPLFQLAGTYSAALITLSNIVFTGKILGPVSLMSLVLFSEEDQRQNLEQNCTIIIVLCAFIAFVIPLNTARLLPNYTLDFAFNKTISIALTIMVVISVVSLLLNNYKNEVRQSMALGFFLLSIGAHILRECFSLLQLILGALFITGGTLLYFKELHNKYLWNS